MLSADIILLVPTATIIKISVESADYFQAHFSHQCDGYHISTKGPCRSPRRRGSETKFGDEVGDNVPRLGDCGDRRFRRLHELYLYHQVDVLLSIDARDVP